MGTIYMIRNTINGMVYIGQTINIRRRWNEELCGKTNTHLARAMKKYGKEKFEFLILEECEDAKMDEREILYIKYYKSYEKTKGYNKTMGGDGYNTRRWSDATRKKASKNRTGEKNHFYGKKHSPETIEKLRLRRGINHPGYGKKHSMESRLIRSAQKKGAKNPMAKTIYQYAIDGEFIGSYDTTVEAANKYNITRTAISNCVNGRSKSAAGYYWTNVRRNTE